MRARELHRCHLSRSAHFGGRRPAAPVSGGSSAVKGPLRRFAPLTDSPDA